MVNQKLSLLMRADLNPESIYGRTNLFSEQIIESWIAVSKYRSAVVLRYFNPIGAHPSGLIFDNPLNEPTNILPLICKVALGHGTRLKIYGTDNNSRDGTGERDYIHIQDIAIAHVEAVRVVSAHKFETVNLSTDRSKSVFELIEAFENKNIN
jgi:UDP-glucose 4-epimerase